MAASSCARRAILSSISSSPKTLFRSVASPSISANSRVSMRKLSPNISRLPVELGCALSLMPFHSATASALLSSKLSHEPGGWGYLSQGLATPL